MHTRTSLLQRGILMAVLALPAPNATASPAGSFAAEQGALANAWRAAPVNCPNPTIPENITRADEVLTLKAAMRELQACLKQGLAIIDARSSAASLVNAAHWATLPKDQQESLQLTLEEANRVSLHGLVEQGQATAHAAVQKIADFKNRQESADEEKMVADGVLAIETYGPRYQHLMERSRALDSRHAALQADGREIDHMNSQLLILNIAAQLSHDGSAYNNMTHAINNKAKIYNRKVELDSEESNSIRSDIEALKQHLPNSMPKASLNKACSSQEYIELCSIYGRK